MGLTGVAEWAQAEALVSRLEKEAAMIAQLDAASAAKDMDKINAALGAAGNMGFKDHPR
jgi:hypothetical protein